LIIGSSKISPVVRVNMCWNTSPDYEMSQGREKSIGCHIATISKCTAFIVMHTNMHVNLDSIPIFIFFFFNIEWSAEIYSGVIEREHAILGWLVNHLL